MPKSMIAMLSAALAGIISFTAGALIYRTDFVENRKKVDTAVQATIDAKQMTADISRQLKITENELRTTKSQLSEYQDQIAVLDSTILELSQSLDRVSLIKNEVRSTPPQKPDTSLRSAVYEPLSKEFFNIYLGETLDSLNSRYKYELYSDLNYEDSGVQISVLRLLHNNDSLKDLHVYTYNDQIFAINATLRDVTEANYEALKKLFDQEYGEETSGFFDDVFGEASHTTSIDGFKIAITLNRDIGFMEDDKIEIAYIHSPLILEVQQEIQRIKEDKLKRDLLGEPVKPASVLKGKILQHLDSNLLLVEPPKSQLVRAVVGRGIGAHEAMVSLDPKYVYGDIVVLELPVDHELLNKVDNESFDNIPIVRFGNYQYIDISGAKRTVAKYRVAGIKYPKAKPDSSQSPCRLNRF